MADIIRCKQQIAHLHQNSPSLQYDLSALTRQSWWDQKAECLEQFGSIPAIKKFLLNPWEFEFREPSHNSADEIPNEFNAADDEVFTTTWSSLIPEWVSQTWQAVQQWAGQIGKIIWLIVVILILWQVFKKVFVFMYDVLNAKRMEYFKIIMPRGDSKSDREREKEIAKDMKEKIGRMAQVYWTTHKLGELSFMDNVYRYFFEKPKATFILHYENWKLYYIVGTYPEYRRILESAIAAQYADASMESIHDPDLFPLKYYSIIPLEPEKEWAYPIRTYKQLADDPMNNVIDSIAKVPAEDTFSIVMTIRPEKWSFNKRAQKLADALYKKDEAVLNKTPFWMKIIMPWKLLSFLRSGPSESLIQKFSDDKSRGDPMIRMVKAEEEALNAMGEEAGNQAYKSGLMLISTSNNHDRTQENLYNIVSAYSVYNDHYNNKLDQPETIADLLWPIIKPIWKASVLFHLPWFGYKKNIFTVSELASLYHFADGTYNRSPIITWMNYKTLPWPDDLPTLKEENEWFSITGIIAEEYKWWDISEILKDKKHPALTIKLESNEIKEEIVEGTIIDPDAETIEENGKKYMITTKTTKKVALKTYKDGVLLWLSVYRNQYKPVYMKKKDRTRHHYVIGKSGTGKSVFISMLARQDIRAGSGVCVIDPHGDLVEDILKYVPKHRAKDIVYFDAGNEERPMGLNLYQISHIAQADRAVNDAVEIFLKMFGSEIFGPRIQEYFKYWSLTLLEDMEDGATLIDVPRLYTDEVYREYKTKKVKNPVVRNFREKTYNAMGDREKQEIIPYFTSKFVSFITNSLIRNIIGQTKSAFNFREVMDSEKILLINLSKGKIWELNAQLLGMIIVSKIYNAAMSRADTAERDRKFFYLYVDEFQNFVTDTFADILSEARKYKLCLIMAHQFIAQLEGDGWGEKSKVKDAVFGNVGTMQSFKVGAPDAEFLEKEYQPALGPQDILGIANYKAYLKLNINNTTTRVFSLNSIWTEDYKSEKIADILKKYSEKKYWRKKEFVDAEIAARLGMMWEADEIPQAWWDDATSWAWAITWMPPGWMPWWLPPGMQLPPGGLPWASAK